MENNKNKKSVKFQGDMLNFYDFIQVFVFTTNHHLKTGEKLAFCKVKNAPKMRIVKFAKAQIYICRSKFCCLLFFGFVFWCFKG